MIEKFKTLLLVKTSLISLYLALTVPIPFISSEQLKLPSIFLLILGLFLIIDITSDYVETSANKISYKTSFLSNLFGKKSWEIFWKDIKSIKSLPTSQGSKAYYFSLNNEENYLVPQRIEKLEEFISLISQNTNFDIDENQIKYISPLWTYKLLTWLSFIMVIGEIVLFWFRYYQY